MMSIRLGAPALAALVLLVAAVTATVLLRNPVSPLVILSEDDVEEAELEDEEEQDQEDEEEQEEREPEPDPQPTDEAAPETTDEDDERVTGTARSEQDDDGEGRGRAARLAGEHPGRGQGRGHGPRGPGHGATVSQYARETSWEHSPDGGCERGQAIAAVARGVLTPDDIARDGLPTALRQRCLEEDD